MVQTKYWQFWNRQCHWKCTCSLVYFPYPTGILPFPQRSVIFNASLPEYVFSEKYSKSIFYSVNNNSCSLFSYLTRYTLILFNIINTTIQSYLNCKTFELNVFHFFFKFKLINFNFFGFVLHKAKLRNILLFVWQK